MAYMCHIVTCQEVCSKNNHVHCLEDKLSGLSWINIKQSPWSNGCPGATVGVGSPGEAAIKTPN